MKSVGWKYRNRKLGNLKSRSIVDALKNLPGFDTWLRADFIIQTINRYLASDEQQIDLHHVPTGNLAPDKAPEMRRQFLIDANVIWKKMVSEDDLSINMTH